jgi:hypothetical protein
LFPDFSETAEEQNHAKRNKSCGTIERRKRPKISKEQKYAEGNKSCGTKEQKKRPKIRKETKQAHGNKSAEQWNKRAKETLGSSYKIGPHRKLTKILTSL